MTKQTTIHWSRGKITYRKSISGAPSVAQWDWCPLGSTGLQGKNSKAQVISKGSSLSQDLTLFLSIKYLLIYMVYMFSGILWSLYPSCEAVTL